MPGRAKRRWYFVRCHLCMKDFHVAYVARDDDAWGVFQRILDGHRTVSPMCGAGQGDLQILRGPR
jgi:hypothetical protein